MLVLVCSPLLTSHNGTNSYPLEGGISATFQHVSDVAYSCFFLWGGVGVCFLMFCRSLVVSLNSLNQAHFPHMSSSTMCLVFCFPPFFASFSFHFFLFPCISIDDMGAISGVFFFWIFLFLACFQMGFYFVSTGWIFEIGLCV